MKKARQILLLGALAILAIVVASGCSSSAEDEAERSTVTAYANVDLGNTRDAASSIDANTVSQLKQLWSLPLHARGDGLHFISSPVVDEDIAYLQDPESNVEAIDLDSGKIIWERKFGIPNRGTHGVVAGSGLIFGATPTSAFALEASTGKEVWSTPLISSSAEVIQMAPGFHDGKVYFSTTPTGSGGGVGVLWALDAESGKKMWHFDQVPRSLWGHPEINYGGGVYYPPAFDGEGSLYVGISHAGPIPGTPRYPWGRSRPGPNLYSQSVVKLDEKTGKVQWYYQITPHGLCNGYLVSPVLAEANGRKVVLGAGVLGILVAIDQKTGKLLWRRPLGKHNGHDNDGLKAMKGEYARLKTPMTVYPGTYGGIAAPMSVNGSTVFVPIVNRGTRIFSQANAEEFGTPRGELVAVDVGTGEIKWKRRFPASLFGPTTVTNDLVFITTYYGTVAAFEAANGKQVWEKNLPVITEGGMTATGDTLLVRAGAPATPELRAYRLRD